MRFKSVSETLCSRTILWFSTLMFFICALSWLSFAHPPAGADDGLYTSAQAEQGKKLYATRCAGCHGAGLGGQSAPPLAGPRFEQNWISTTTLDDLFFLMRTTMPLSMSKSLTAEQHAAVFAYVLQQNGYPAGNTPVQPETPQLKTMRVLSRITSSLASGGPAPLYVPGDPKNIPPEPPPSFIPGDAKNLPTNGGPTQEQLNAAARSGHDWLYHTHDYSGARFVPLNQIDSTNAKRLQVVCAFQVGEVANFQTGPIVYQGTMYITTSHTTIALDASNCRPKWRQNWEPKSLEPWGPHTNRGVAIKDGRIVRGTADGYLLELNAQTGDLIWARRVADAMAGETFSMPPMIFEDLILIGPAGSENGISGWIGAFRLSDGTEVWRFKTVPGVDEYNSQTWKNPTHIKLGGGAVWTPLSLDPEKGELYVAVANPAPDLPSELRPGDNRYSSSVIALDVHTGQLRWYKQMVPNDAHDWDLTQVSPIFKTKVNGQERDLIATVGKDGILRLVDRTTHDTLYATPVTTIKDVDKPVTPEGVSVCPGVLGGVEWSGPAFNPASNLLYVGAVDWCTTFYSAKTARFIPGKLYMGGTIQLDDTSQGWLTAIDSSSGKVRWHYRSPRSMVAAVTTTSGNIVFGGELTGDFIVLDAVSGDVLYRFNTGGSIGGGIVTYEIDGKQYVGVMSGRLSGFWIDNNPGAPTVFLFALP
ncbi:MAG: PQQ-binding-like beta-propeller repeat protein [Acidobacteriia bacterium]|nr:PQQ-binding-like beta-propeller repeat protein [Terriglobia bacterium]